MLLLVCQMTIATAIPLHVPVGFSCQIALSFLHTHATVPSKLHRRRGRLFTPEGGMPTPITEELCQRWQAAVY